MEHESEIEKKQHEPTDVLLAWSAPSRPFKKRDGSFFQTIAAIVFLLVVILFFIREWLIVGVALSVVFVAYVLAAVPPEYIKYQLTKKGVWIDEAFYRYAELTEYWFEEHLGTTVVMIVIPTRRIGRLILVIPKEKKEEIDTLFRERLVFREKPLKTAMDTMADWMKTKIPLEDEKPSRNAS